MTKPLDQDDFTQEPVANTSKSSKVPSWVAVVSGCGCASLFILGIISAIALPSFLTKVHIGKQAHAGQYIGFMAGAQQTYRLKNPTFADSLPDLKIPIEPPNTVDYSYKIVPQSDKSKSVMMTAVAKGSGFGGRGFRSYTGAVFVIKKGKEDFTTVRVVCESTGPTTTPPSMPAAPKDELTRIECPAGSRSVTR